MRRASVFGMMAVLLLASSHGAANPSGVGSGTFDAQCGGACHGDADMNRSSPATVSVEAPSVAYDGLLTSVSVTVSDIQTTSNGLLGVFLLSDLTGAGDTPADDGWAILSNSEGGTENYVEARISSGQTEHTVSWTLRAPSIGTYNLHAAVHHGTQDGSEAPFFGSTLSPTVVEVVEVPENLPRLAADFAPPTQVTVGKASEIDLQTEFVNSVTVEWRTVGGESKTVVVQPLGDETWSFTLPPSVQPVVLEWRAHLEGDGPSQTTPWFQVNSDDPSWSVDETTAYAQSLAMLLAATSLFVALQHRRTASELKAYEAELDDVGGEA
jgi:hypothetical protein